jgi:hypothetical protein
MAGGSRFGRLWLRAVAVVGILARLPAFYRFRVVRLVRRCFRQQLLVACPCRALRRARSVTLRSQERRLALYRFPVPRLALQLLQVRRLAFYRFRVVRLVRRCFRQQLLVACP